MEMEMTKQQKIIEALQKIKAEAKYWETDDIKTLRWQIGNIWHLANQALSHDPPPNTAQ